MTDKEYCLGDVKRFRLMMYLPSNFQFSYHCNHDIPKQKAQELENSTGMAFFAGQSMLGGYYPTLLRYDSYSTKQDVAAPQSILVIEDKDRDGDEILSLLLASTEVEPVDVCKEIVKWGRHAIKDYEKVFRKKHKLKQHQRMNFSQILETYSSLLEYRLDKKGYLKRANITSGNFTPVFLTEKKESELSVYTFSDHNPESKELREKRPSSMVLAGLTELDRRFQEDFFPIIRELDPYFPQETGVKLDAILLEHISGKKKFTLLNEKLNGTQISLGLCSTQENYENHPSASLYNIRSRILNRSLETDSPVSKIRQQTPLFEQEIHIEDTETHEGQNELMEAWK